jgi:hypothetical protein
MNILRHIHIACLLTAVLALGSKPANAQRYNFTYFTEFEATRFGEPQWFRTGDTIRGGLIFSNDVFSIRGNPHFAGFIGTASDHLRFWENQDAPAWADSVFFNHPPIYLQRGAVRFIRSNAQPFVNDMHGRKMTWIKLKGSEGVDIYQYPMGGIRTDCLYQHFGVPNFQSVFVDGEVEIEGVLAGSLTIGSSGDMHLIDDVRYINANPRTGDFWELATPHMLGLVSEANIIIDDTYRNGKRDGVNAEPDNWNRHSIIINAALMAPNGSITFQHQNYDWENYQGPEPDERGTIHIKGKMLQSRRGELHNTNHSGTGYNLNLRGDSRFDYYLPPGIFENLIPVYQGHYDKLEIVYPYTYYQFNDVEVDTLILNPGVGIWLQDRDDLIVRRYLDIRGTADSTVNINTYIREEARIIIPADEESICRITNFRTRATFDVYADSCTIENTIFYSDVTLGGNFEVRGSEFKEGLRLVSGGRAVLDHNLIKEGLRVDDARWNLTVANNTIVGGSPYGVDLQTGEGVTLVNNIIYDHRIGVSVRDIARPTLRYNLVWRSQLAAYQDCEPGVGSFEADPIFEDDFRDDYHLRRGSPCIDTGDPASPRDPDGTRADMGAFYFPQRLAASPPPELPVDPAVTVSPNPFNSRTTVSIRGMGASEWSLLDVSGRKWAGERVSETASFTIDGDGLPAGVYIVMVRGERASRAVKVALVK